MFVYCWVSGIQPQCTTGTDYFKALQSNKYRHTNYSFIEHDMHVKNLLSFLKSTVAKTHLYLCQLQICKPSLKFRG